MRFAVVLCQQSALAAASLRSNVDLREMASSFLPGLDQDGAGNLTVGFKDAAGAIADIERVEDIIHSGPHEG